MVETETTKTHFKHPDHPLVIYRVNDDRTRCNMCRRYIRFRSTAYGCSEMQCKFFLHRYCAELAEKIEDPRHHNHPLFLSVYQKSPCEGCSRHRKGTALCYSCGECDYTLDVECAPLPNPDPNNPTVGFQFHGHRLLLSSQQHSVGSSLWCCVCKGPIREDVLDDFAVFRCGEHHECEFVIHFHCAPLAFPRSIPHEHCSFHTLELRYRFVEDDTGEYYCDACEGRRNPKRPVYRCIQCPDSAYYVAHLSCVISPQVLQELADDYDERSEKANLYHYTLQHKHHLIHLQQPSRKCNVCPKVFEKGEFVYVCRDCHIYLHESCSKVPLEIKDLAHPEHPLTLVVEKSAKGFVFQCRVCSQFRLQFIYRCNSCNFNLCIQCCTGGLSRPNARISYEDYEHPMHQLFLFDSKNFRGKCNRCGLESKTPIFKCIEQICEYNVHFECAPFSFPKTTETPRQRTTYVGGPHGFWTENQALTLYYKGGQKSTKCFVCKEEIECEYVNFYADMYDRNEAAHMRCALSEKIPDLVHGYKSRMDPMVAKEKMVKEMKRLRKMEEELKKECVANSNKLRALKVECAQLMEEEELETPRNYPGEKRIAEIDTKLSKLLT